MNVGNLIERLNDAWRKLHDDGDEYDVCDTIAEAADALEAARAGGWQPMETAPKDGTRVLLWYEWHDLPVVGDFRHDRWWSVHSLGGNLVYNKDEVRMPIATARPAYWRPLPAPPAIESAREERDTLAHGGEE